MRTAAVVLAAGKSERMGTNKLLLEVAGRTILDRLLDALDESVVNEIIVVLGHRPEELRPIVVAHRAEVALNPDYEEGMTSSFRAGLKEVSADAAFLVLGDQLGLKADLLASMADRMESEPAAMIVSPVYEGRRGHPVLFRRLLFTEIQGMSCDETIKDIIDRHGDAHRYVDGDLLCMMDIDTPEDFERVRSLFEKGPGA